MADLEEYLTTITEERDRRPAEAMLADEIHRLRIAAGEEHVTPAEFKTEYTREELIDLCDRGIVPQDKWSDRDSAGAQMGLGKCRALLLAGCDFRMKDERPMTDERTVWIRVAFRGFNAFEIGDEGIQEELFYLPTADRLLQCEGRDWY